MTDHSRAIAVGASADELAHLTQCLSGWELVNAPLDEEQTGISCPLPAAQLVTSRHEISQGTAVRSIGEASFIIKPFEKKELRDEIGELLRSSQV